MTQVEERIDDGLALDQQEAGPAVPSAQEALGACMDVLAERVALAVEAFRDDGDVPDHERGSYFPPDLIIRDARRPASGQVPSIPFDGLPPRLIDLALRLDLSDFECAVLLLAAAPGLQPRFEHFFMVLNNEVETRGPTVSTAFALAGQRLDDPAARACLRPDRPLISYGLIQISMLSRTLLTQVLTVPERVIAYLLGDDEPDPIAVRLTRPVDRSIVPWTDLPLLDLNLGRAPIVLRARAGSAGVEQAMRLADVAGFVGLLVVDAEGIEGPVERAADILRACLREALLSGRVLCIDSRYAAPGVPLSDVVAELAHAESPAIVLIGSRSAVGAWLPTELPMPDAAMRSRWWQTLRPDHEGWQPAAIALMDPEEVAGTDDHVSGARRRQKGLGRLQRVEPAFRLSDVVLDVEHHERLAALLDRARLRGTVLDEWGMRPGGMRGRGVTALFTGTPGTGKTMAAEALAGELLVPLFVVDLAAVVDKYIGETEKNLEGVFAAVESEDGVLLFDEADALFGKRSEVSDARDRYANLEVAYLLQRIESFDGLAILTTNMKANLDPAFIRRLDAVIEFNEPDRHERRRLWAMCLEPAGNPLPEDDLDALSQIPLAGGAIRSVVVSAAYWAAAHSESINRRAVLAALVDEWRKSGRLGFPHEHVPGWGEE